MCNLCNNNNQCGNPNPCGLNLCLPIVGLAAAAGLYCLISQEKKEDKCCNAIIDYGALAGVSGSYVGITAGGTYTIGITATENPVSISGNCSCKFANSGSTAVTYISNSSGCFDLSLQVAGLNSGVTFSGIISTATNVITITPTLSINGNPVNLTPSSSTGAVGTIYFNASNVRLNYGDVISLSYNFSNAVTVTVTGTETGTVTVTDSFSGAKLYLSKNQNRY